MGPGIYGGIVKREENGEVGRMMLTEMVIRAGPQTEKWEILTELTFFLSLTIKITWKKLEVQK